MGAEPIPSAEVAHLHRSIARRAALAVLGLLALAPGARGRDRARARSSSPTARPTGRRPTPRSGRFPTAPSTRSGSTWRCATPRRARRHHRARCTNPASASYGQYLTPGQFRARYAPTDADVSAVRAYLRQAGFAVSADRPDNNRWVEASGTTAQVEKAFGTQLRTYQHRGRTLQAPNGDLASRARSRAASPASPASTAARRGDARRRSRSRDGARARTSSTSAGRIVPRPSRSTR